MELNFIDIHTHTTKSRDNLIQIVNLDLKSPCPEQGYYSYGIHPWALDKADFQIEEALSLLEARLQSPNVRQVWTSFTLTLSSKSGFSSDRLFCRRT